MRIILAFHVQEVAAIVQAKERERRPTPLAWQLDTDAPEAIARRQSAAKVHIHRTLSDCIGGLILLCALSHNYDFFWYVAYVSNETDV